MKDRVFTSTSRGKDSHPNAVLGANTLELLKLESYEDIELINTWQRLGSETYCSDFRINRDGHKKHLIAKACIKFAPYETMQDWLDRRNRLNDFGVSVPRLEVIDRATIVEEFIPYNFIDRHKELSGVDRVKLESNFKDLLDGVHEAGFAPQNLRDVRSRSQDAVIVDFGEDLGPYYPEKSENYSSDYRHRFLDEYFK